jgi:hypothetical protein
MIIRKKYKFMVTILNYVIRSKDPVFWHARLSKSISK